MEGVSIPRAPIGAPVSKDTNCRQATPVKMWMSVCIQECAFMGAVPIWMEHTSAAVTMVTKLLLTAKPVKM